MVLGQIYYRFTQNVFSYCATFRSKYFKRFNLTRTKTSSKKLRKNIEQIADTNTYVFKLI